VYLSFIPRWYFKLYSPFGKIKNNITCLV
jgi:hypothetical protein